MAGIILKILPPAPYKGGVWRVKTRPAPPRKEHYLFRGFHKISQLILLSNVNVP